MRRLVLIRHGETEWSRQRRHTGWTDIPLTSRGERQAMALREALRDVHPGLVLVSPLQRARATCELAGFGAAALPDADLREWNYGRFEGRLRDDIQAERPDWDIWTDGVDGGETLDQVAERSRRVITRVSAADGDVLVFAHGHLLRILTACWLDLVPSAARHFALGPAGICELGHEHRDTAILRWNEKSHTAETDAQHP